MSAPFLVPIDLNNLELRNALAQLLGADPTGIAGKFFYHTGDHTIHFYNGTSWIHLGTLDQMTVAADVAFSGFKITGLGTPTSSTDAATKGYVDAAAAGLDPKGSVRLATAAALPANSRATNTITASGNGALTVDGNTVNNGERILVKDEVTGANNGIYTVTDKGSAGTPFILDRATDADISAEVTAGMFVFVEEGTANADSGWVLTTNNAITLNTTALTFVQFSGAGQITAGAGLTKTGNTLAVGAGTGITVNADDVALTIPVAVSSGGTGGITAAAAKSGLGFANGFAASVGDGSATSYNVDHNLGTKDVTVLVNRVSDGVQVFPDVTMSTINRVIVAFAVAPTTNQYRVVVVAI